MTLKDRLKQFDLLPEIKEGSGDTILRPELQALCKELATELSIKIASIPVWFEYSKDEQKELILSYLKVKLNEKSSDSMLTDAEHDRVIAYFLKIVYGFGSLDFLLAMKEVSTVLVKSNNDVYMDFDGEIIKSDLVIDKKQVLALIKNLLKLSSKKASVVSFRQGNFYVTILSEPVCCPQLIIRKLPSENFNFDYFKDKQILNSDIAEFLKASLNAGKRFLVSAPCGTGKTKLLNAFVNESEPETRVVLFEEGAFINTENPYVERYDIEHLSPNEQLRLMDAVLLSKPKYIYSNSKDVNFNLELVSRIPEGAGFAAKVEAENFQDAIDFYTTVQVSKLKCSEKYAKVKFAKYFDYIIQLEKQDKNFVIKTILEASNSTSGAPMLTEKLVFSSGEYKCDFPAPAVIIPPKDADAIVEDVPEKKSFSARFRKV